MKNTLNVKPSLWEKVMAEYNPKAPTFEEFYNAVEKEIKKDFGNKYKDLARNNINGLAVDYRGYLQCFNDGDIDREQFLNAKVWAAVSGLYMFEA